MTNFSRDYYGTILCITLIKMVDALHNAFMLSIIVRYQFLGIVVIILGIVLVIQKIQDYQQF